MFISLSSLRPIRITVAPNEASSWAVHRPIPLPPPVITIVCFKSFLLLTLTDMAFTHLVFVKGTNDTGTLIGIVNNVCAADFPGYQCEEMVPPPPNASVSKKLKLLMPGRAYRETLPFTE